MTCKTRTNFVYDLFLKELTRAGSTPTISEVCRNVLCIHMYVCMYVSLNSISSASFVKLKHGHLKGELRCELYVVHV